MVKEQERRMWLGNWPGFPPERTALSTGSMPYSYGNENRKSIKISDKAHA